MPNLVNSVDIEWTETSGDLSANAVPGVFGRTGSIGNDAAFGTDDTTGTSVATASSTVLPQGLFYVYRSHANLSIEVSVNAAWRTVASGVGTSLVVSDGANVRVANSDASSQTFFARRVTL